MEDLPSYYSRHRERLLERQKQYNAAHKDAAKEYQKQYWTVHKARLQEKHKEYRQTHPKPKRIRQKNPVKERPVKERSVNESKPVKAPRRTLVPLVFLDPEPEPDPSVVYINTPIIVTFD